MDGTGTMNDALAPSRAGRVRARRPERQAVPQATSQAAPRQPAEAPFVAADLLAALRRHFALLGTVLLCVPLLALIAVQQMPRQYTASANVLVEQTQYSVREIQSIIASLDSSEVLQSQIEVVRSQAMAERLADRLELHRHPGFAERAAAWRAALAWAADQARPALAEFGVALPELARPTPSASEARARLVARTLERFEVSIRGRSRVLALGFTAPDPALAAQAANLMAELYITDQLAAKLAAVRRASSWLDDQVVTVRREVADAEARLNQLRIESGLVSGVSADLTTEQVSRIGSELVLARGLEAQARARLGQLEAARASGTIEGLPNVVQSAAIATLRQQEAQARREMSAALNTYGTRHPDYLRAQRTLADVQRLIGQEVARLSQSLGAEAAAASARVASLEAAMERAQWDAEQATRSTTALSTLTREADAARNLLATLLVRAQQMAQQTAIEQPDARILSPAVVPQGPSSPRTTMILGGSVMLALLIGLGLVWLVETQDRSLRSGTQVERELGLSCLALLPEIRRRGRRGATREPVDRPRSAFSEALRSLRTGLWLQARRAGGLKRSGGGQATVLLVTAARPGEGKTTLAVALARSAALAGDRVLLVDCDLRKPSVASAMGLLEAGGLSELLAGEVGPEMVVQQDTLTEAMVLTTGAPMPHGIAAFHGAGFEGLLGRLRVGRDLVILDGPPVFAMADARLLGMCADATVLCTRWRSTPWPLAEAALASLREAGARVAGVVLTRVDARAHARSGYADGEVYQSRYAAYFRS